MLSFQSGMVRGVALTCLILSVAPGAHAAQTWTVKGKIVVDHLLPELVQMHGARSAVPHVQVKLSARSKIPLGWGTWNSWGKQTTKNDGSFQFREKHGGDRRQFKIRVLFDSNSIRLKEGKETSVLSWDNNGFPIGLEFDLTNNDWFVVHNDKDGAAKDGRKAGMIDLGNIVIKKGVARKLADLWVLYDQVLDLFAGYGSAYAFQKKFARV